MNKPQIKITSRRQNLEKAEKNIKPIHSNFLITLNLNQQYHKDEHKANLNTDMDAFDEVINKFLNGIEGFIRLPSGVQFNDDTIIVQSLCEHIFHEDCIKIWFLTKLSSNIYISKE